MTFVTLVLQVFDEIALPSSMQILLLPTLILYEPGFMSIAS